MAAQRKREQDLAVTPPSGADWARLIRHVYTEAMAGSRDERGAFDAAVAVFLSHHPDVSEQQARRGVALIICGDR